MIAGGCECSFKTYSRVKIKKILVSQPRPSSEKSPYFDIAKKFGVEIVFRPFIKVEGLSSKEFRQQRITLQNYTAIIFTARTAVDHFFRLCEEMRYNVPETLKYFCATEQIALYLQKYIVYRKRRIFFSTNGKLDGLEAAFIRHNKEKYLYVVSELHTAQLEQLEKYHLDVTPVVMYRTVSNDFGPDEKFDYDMLLFFSPSGIESLKKNFPDFKQGDICIGCFGSKVAAAIKDAGLRLDLEAPNEKAQSMTSALEMFLKERK